jgi:hypothetical protein
MRPTDNDYGSEHSSLHGGLQHHEPLYTDALHNEDVAHEHSDVDVRTLLMFTLGLATVTGVVMLLMWGVFRVLESNAASKDPVLSPHAIPEGQLPPQPRLLTNEPSNLKKLREMEAQSLSQYGWVNQAAGVARLPIEEAKKRLLEKGLAVRADAPSDPWIGTRAAGASRGESSSGRAIPLKPGAGQPAPEAAPSAPPTPAAPAAPHKGGH